MTKLCINSRDELHVIPLDNVAYLQASGSYTDFYFSDGRTLSEVQCLSYFEEQIRKLYPADEMPFFRLGRSFLINTNLVSSVSLSSLHLVFMGHGQLSLRLSKPMLRRIKEYLVKVFREE